MQTNLWLTLLGNAPGSRYLKGNVTALNGDGSYTIATSDGGTIRARPLPTQTWSIGAGVFVQDGNGAEALIVDQTITLERHYSDAD